jgi:acetate kinase
MKILVINSGSSSLKYQLFNIDNEEILAKGLCERIGIDNSFLKHTSNTGRTTIIEKDMYNHKIAIEMVINALTDKDIGVIHDMNEISAVGHRVVHGGEKFHDSVIIDEEVLKTIKDCIELAPLHNPPNITGIIACREIMRSTPMVAVFDTAFHQTLPKFAYMYALKYDAYTKYGIRKYGFHGTSHKYVSQRAASLLGKPIEKTKIITCHLGNGASVCAVKNGKSVDTSMGFTPLDGLAMGTRCGRLDPAVIPYLMEKENLDYRQINEYLNKQSGLLGISGISSDFRDILEAAENGNDRAQLAIDMFSYRVKKYIGEYSAVLDGADCVVFTAGIGEWNNVVRKKSLTGLNYLGIELDEEKNRIVGKETEITTDRSATKVFVIPTNEELAIARETFDIMKNIVNKHQSFA